MGLRPDSEISAADLGLPEGHEETANVVAIRDCKVVSMQDYRTRAEAVEAVREAGDGS